MNIRTLMWTATAGALLTLFCAEVLVARRKIPFTHASSGAIVSIDANHLVVTHRKNGKPETLSFALTPATVRNGDLAVGSVVSVHYIIENNQRLATGIQAHQSKAPRTPK